MTYHLRKPLARCTALSLAAILLLFASATSASFMGRNKDACPDVDIGFDVAKVAGQAERLSSHSWEYGAAAEALLELYDPDVSVFSTNAFPNGKIPKKKTKSTDYARQFIRTNNDTLVDGDGAVGDPASLGVSALLLAQFNTTYLTASTRQLAHIFAAPRFSNGAISQRETERSVWADFVYMAPPFIAYYGVAASNASLVREAVRQSQLYRDALHNATLSPKLWQHILAETWADTGRWSTGNAWAAAGMARVLATVEHWGVSGGGGGWEAEKGVLVGLVKEIVDGAVEVGVDSQNGLLRNYLDDESWFGETSGTALLAAAVYRMVVLAPGTFATEKYLGWADALREAVAKHVDDSGILGPAVNPLDWSDRTPVYTGSPEGQSFGVLLYAAYKDCVCEGYCRQ